MALYHVFDQVTNRRTGVPMMGVRVRVKYDDTDTEAPIYADQNGELFEPDNTCLTDADGMFSFYVNPGEYKLEFLVGSEIIKTIADFRPAEVGPAGPANSTYATTAELESADTANVSAILAETGKAGTFTTREYADFTALVEADTSKVNYVRSVFNPTKVWVRTSILTAGAAQVGTAAGVTVEAELSAKANALGIAATDTHLGTFTGGLIPANKNAKEALQVLSDAVQNTSGNAATKVNATAVGVAATDANMGTTPGTILSDNGTAKQWFQESETAIEARAKAADLSADTGAELIGTPDGSTAQERIDATTPNSFSYVTWGIEAATQKRLRDETGDKLVFTNTGAGTFNGMTWFDVSGVATLNLSLIVSAPATAALTWLNSSQAAIGPSVSVTTAGVNNALVKPEGAVLARLLVSQTTGATFTVRSLKVNAPSYAPEFGSDMANQAERGRRSSGLLNPQHLDLSVQSHYIGTTYANQDHVFDHLNGHLYVLQHSSGGGGPAYIRRFRSDTFEQASVNLLDQLNATYEFGHQTLTLEHLVGGAVKLWCSSGPSGSNKIKRFDYVAGGNPANIQEYTLWEPELFTETDIITAAISLDQQYLVCRAKADFASKYLGGSAVRVWRLQDIIEHGPGDVTKLAIHEFKIETYPLMTTCQGIACDGHNVYIGYSAGAITDPNEIFCYDLRGNLQWRRNSLAAYNDALITGEGLWWEGEGMAWWQPNANAEPVLTWGFVLGGSAQYTHAIYALGCNILPAIYNQREVRSLGARRAARFSTYLNTTLPACPLPEDAAATNSPAMDEMVDTGVATNYLRMWAFNSGSSFHRSPKISGVRSEATVGNHGAVPAGKVLMTLAGLASNGTIFRNCANIHVQAGASAAQSSTNAGGKISFRQCLNGTTTLVDTFSVEDDGVTKLPYSYSTTTASAANMFIGSDFRVLRSTSSIRFKRDVEDMDKGTVDRFFEVARPIWYRSTSEADNPAWGWYGLIAEELADEFPQFVHWSYPLKQVEREETETVEGEDGEPVEVTHVITETVEDKNAPMVPDGVMYERIVAPLIAKVQELEARLRDLEAGK